MNFSELNGGTAIQINDFDIRDINEESAEIIKGYLYENVVVVLKRQDRTPANYTNFINHIGPIANWNQFNFNPEIELIENLGNEKIVYMKKEEHQLSAKIPSNIEIGNKIGFDQNDIFIFDENGKRLKS